MNHKIYQIIFSILCMGLTLFSCTKENKDDVITPNFDKRAMLENIGDQIIITSYTDLKLKSEEFDKALTLFNNKSDSSNLNLLQNSFKNFYKSWQACAAFEFGPAETESLRANINTFPTDTNQINSNISAGAYNLESASNMDAKGFPAIDYLLFGSDFSKTLLNFSAENNFTNRKSYLASLSTEIKNRTNKVQTGWLSSGSNYINTFKNNTGSDVGGSIGMLVNQLNYDFELLKNSKIGVPLGKRTLGNALPDKVESFYSQQSLLLALENLKALENIYLGRNAQNIDGLGLDDYLDQIDAKYGNASLNQTIKDKFNSVKTKLAAVPHPLSQAVILNATTVDQAYAELQQLVVLLKVDMPSALGVLITYQDNDGD